MHTNHKPVNYVLGCHLFYRLKLPDQLTRTSKKGNNLRNLERLANSLAPVTIYTSLFYDVPNLNIRTFRNKINYHSFQPIKVLIFKIVLECSIIVHYRPITFNFRTNVLEEARK